MRFRQLACPTARNFYDVCLNDAPFYQNELLEGNRFFPRNEMYNSSTVIETVADHNYSRPWTDDPTMATALPRVQLFFNAEST